MVKTLKIMLKQIRRLWENILSTATYLNEYNTKHRIHRWNDLKVNIYV